MTYALNILWNPSEGIQIGPLMIRFYSLMFVVAFSLGWYLTKKIFERENEPIEKLDSLFIWTVLATLLGARLGHVFFYDWEYYSNHKMEILLPFRFDPFEFTGFSGLASHGAAIAIIGSMYFFSKKIMKRPLFWVMDRVAIAIAVGGAFVRLGNFFNSEIIGHETKSVFGIRFLHDTFSSREAVQLTGIANPKEAYNAIATNPQFSSFLAQVPAKHPAQLYEALGYVFVFLVVYYAYWKTNVREKVGFIFGIFLIMLWSIRFVVEFVKESQGGFETALGNSLSTGQWLSIPFLIIGFILVFRAKKEV
ncbi:MAG: prolipoprotein diacylglyceryl transferase [Flavobacterium sp.]